MDAILTFLQLRPFVPADLLVVAVLIIMEGLLSCDNAVVLALRVKHLPPEQRGRALRYGIIGAYVFRIIALMLATWIISQWWLKMLGGAYLLWMAVKHLTKRPEPELDATAPTTTPHFLGLSPFWSTVIAVELTDIAFSVDSIAAAVALSSKLWVLIVGGLLGILAMRFAAHGFLSLLQRFPHLEGAAFAAVGVIGIKLLVEVPVDLFGSQRDFAPGTTYSSAAQYLTEVERQCPPRFQLAHTVTINTAAAPPPDPALITDAKEFRAAHSAWNLHLRPFFEIEGWLSSLVVFAIFLFGFRKPAH
jgi:YkoY family integral membrane protein